MAMTKAEKAAVDELRHMLALRWPTEAKPTPLFSFGDYDRQSGDVIEGCFFATNGHSVVAVDLRKKRADEAGWQGLRFNDSTGVIRGGYFRTEPEARLVVLWRECNDAAKTLAVAWNAFERSKP